MRIRCGHPVCNDYDLCVPCFANGSSSRDHNPSTHAFSVIEQHSIPIYNIDWGADEELLLLEGAEVYGLGSWADIADHIGGFRTKDEVRDHYIDTYINSSKFPLPERVDPKDTSLEQELPREKFQARKKRRIEERKDAAKNAPPAAPKQKPTASVPACHEVQGFMPGRLEFEVEYANEAEEAVQHMQFEPGDGINPRTGEMDPEMELKMVVMDIYNSRLTARAERKKIIFEHKLLEYRKNAGVDKKRTREERELMGKVKPASRITCHDDFEKIASSFEYEHNLRQAVAQLQDWRQMKLIDMHAGEKYESDKHQRAQRPAPTGSFDRLAGVRPSKPPAPIETPSATTALTAPELSDRLKAVLQPPKQLKGPLTNGTSNHTAQRTVHHVVPIPNITPLKLTHEHYADLQIISREEMELCAALHLTPKAYIVIKEGLMREALKTNGGMKRKVAREVCKV